MDLLILTSVKGLKYYGLVEELRAQLKKKVDALDENQLKDNINLIHEILKDGIKIYRIHLLKSIVQSKKRPFRK